MLRKFNFSGNFLTHYENFYSKNVDVENDSKSNNNLNPFLMRVALNIDAEINNRLKFYTTLGMSKFWNQSQRSPQETGERRTQTQGQVRDTAAGHAGAGPRRQNGQRQ